MIDFETGSTNGVTYAMFKTTRAHCLWGWRARLATALRNALERFLRALWVQQQHSRARFYRRHGEPVPPGYCEW